MKHILKHIFMWVVLAAFIAVAVPKSVFADEFISVKTSDELRARFALNTGGNVRMDEDITLSGNYSMKSPMNLDLNGHVLTIANGKCLFAYSDITVFDSQNKEDSGIIGSFDNNYILRVGSTTTSGSITLENSKIISTSTNGGRGILIIKGSVTVNGGLIEAPGYAIANNDAAGEITLNNGTIRATTNVAGIYSNVNGSKLTVNGGTISSPNFAVYQAGTFTMNNGVIESAGTAIRINPNSQVEINGGRIETTSSTIGNALALQDGTVAVINNAEIYAKNGVGEDLGASCIVAFKNVDLTINNAVLEAWGHAISGNGSWEGDTEGTNAKITINDGKITSSYGAALYIPQINGETVINGGEMTGATGIEIRAGKLTVKGGKITGTGEYSVIDNTNGNTTTGAAISVAQHTSKQPIEVIIEGGEMSAAVPISFTNPLNLDQSIVDQVSITARGGYFSSSVDEYVEDGYSEVWMTHDGKRMVYITKPHYIDTNNSEHFRVARTRALVLDEIELETNAPEGYIVKFEIEDSDGNKIEVVNNKFIMPDSNIVITATLERIPEEPATPETPSEDVPEVPDTGIVTPVESITKTSVLVGAIVGGLAGLFASRKKIKTLFE